MESFTSLSTEINVILRENVTPWCQENDTAFLAPTSPIGESFQIWKWNALESVLRLDGS